MLNVIQRKSSSRLELFLQKAGKELDLLRDWVYVLFHRAEIAQKKRDLLDRAIDATGKNARYTPGGRHLV